MFREEAPRMLAQLVQACGAGARSDAARVAHTLKGTAGTVGANYLARVCKDAEKALSGEASAADEAAIEAVRLAIDRTLQALAA
jgi:HPt (histidine-containing phosphotransfer) domain-containing protein